MLRIAHADPAAMMERHPGRAARGVEQRVEERPVADRVAAVLHRLGFAVGRGDRARIEMVAADDDKIGRAHVLTPVTNAHSVCRLLLAQKHIQSIYSSILPFHYSFISEDTLYVHLSHLITSSQHYTSLTHPSR